MKHQFLRYRHAEIYLTYGFLWRSDEGDIESAAFSEGMRGVENGWRNPLLHERVIGGIHGDKLESSWVASYQPSFVLKRRCLEWNKDLGEGAVIAPLKRGVTLPRLGEGLETIKASVHEGGYGAVKARLSCTVRLFENGSGVVTLRINPQLKELNDPAERFVAIHWTLRLTPNMDLVPEAHEESMNEGENLWPICDSLWFQSNLGSVRIFTLMESMRGSALKDLPASILTKKSATIGAECGAFAYEKEMMTEAIPAIEWYGLQNWQENQAPFAFVVAVVDEDSVSQIRRGGVALAQELGSIYARLTLDNRKVLEHFLELSEEYLCSSLGFDEVRQRLPNYGHDDRLFFYSGRRGAIAVTADVDAIPNVFVVPSLLNLFEIIRGRLASGIAVGAALADMAERLAELDVTEEGRHTSEEFYARLRKVVVQNYQSPLEHLFDGGTATELALKAEEELLANRVWNNVRRSFDMVDRLRSAWVNKRFRVKYGE